MSTRIVPTFWCSMIGAGQPGLLLASAEEQQGHQAESGREHGQRHAGLDGHLLLGLDRQVNEAGHLAAEGRRTRPTAR
jgi:hypothetical protein